MKNEAEAVKRMTVPPNVSRPEIIRFIAQVDEVEAKIQALISDRDYLRGRHRICRACGAGEVKVYLDLGEMPRANAFLDPYSTGVEPRLRTRVGWCKHCGMSQLLDLWPREQVFNGNYAYYSSGSQGMRRHWMDLAKEIDLLLLSSEAPLVEIGCNDGALLEHLARLGPPTIGIEPSANVAEAARGKGLNVEQAFFDEELADRIAGERGQAQLLVGGNVLSHIEDLAGLTRAMDRLLLPGGIFIFEDPWVRDILTLTAYDQIYNEHVYFFSLHALRHLFESQGWSIFRAENHPVHGGSLRVYGCRAGERSVEKSVLDMLGLEWKSGLKRFKIYERFGKRVTESRAQLLELLEGLNGKRVVGYAASSKGTVILNYCGIGSDRLPYVVDSTPSKVGKLMPGVHVPILTPAMFHSDNPDYALLLAYNHQEEICGKEKDWLDRGGKFITHVPYPRVIQ